MGFIEHDRQKQGTVDDRFYRVRGTRIEEEPVAGSKLRRRATLKAYMTRNTVKRHRTGNVVRCD